MLTPVTAIVHVIVALIAIGYAQNYYFHLRKLVSHQNARYLLISLRPPQEQRSLNASINFFGQLLECSG